MGQMAPPFYGNKKSKFYENKKAKALRIKAEQDAIIAECDKHIAQANEDKTSSTKA